MARDVTGTGTILASARKICRMVNRFGTVKLSAQTNPEFAAAVNVLVVACVALDAVDNFVAVIDRTPGGTGVYDEDIPISAGQGSLVNELLDAQAGT